MKKIVLGMLIIMIMPIVSAGTVKLYPVEDAYTDSSAASSTFDNSDLRVGNDLNHGKHRSYLKFDLSELDGVTITDATFNIDPIINVGTLTANLYYVSSDSWSETSLTWNNAPSHSTLVDSKTVSSTSRVEFDVDSLIDESDNTLSIALVSAQESTTNLYTQFFSGSSQVDDFYKPYIEVTAEGVGCSTEADTDCDGCVSLLEMVNLMLEYKTGGTSLDLLEMVNLMLRYKGGEISC